MQEEKVVLVDKFDNQVGLMPKMEAHLKGLLHRAFSVIIFDSSGRILLQKRASTKYHTPNLWSNTSEYKEMLSFDMSLPKIII